MTDRLRAIRERHDRTPEAVPRTEAARRLWTPVCCSMDCTHDDNGDPIFRKTITDKDILDIEAQASGHDDIGTLLALVDEMALVLGALACLPYPECGHRECEDAHAILAEVTGGDDDDETG